MYNQTLKEGAALSQSKRWSPLIQAVTEGYKRSHNGKSPDSNILSTTAIMLENTRRQIARMDETTKAVNLGNFIDYGFGIITAVMPSLAANEIVSVQPLKARTGEIFYMDFKYGSTKAGATAGNSAISPFTGAAGNASYTSEDQTSEALGTIASGSATGSFNLIYLPISPKSVSITDGTNTWTDATGTGALTGTGLTSGTVNYTTGAVSLTLSANAATDLSIGATYKVVYGNQDVNAQIPELDMDLKSIQIVTTTRKLRARWLFDVAYELQQTHGVDADAELSAALAAEVRHEIDMEILNDIRTVASAGNTEYTWSKTAPAGVAYVDYKDTFVDKLIEMSNVIFSETRRGEGNFIIAGINVCSLIESLGGRFVPNSSGMKTGPYLSGVLDGRWKVIKNPYYGADQFVVGYKGESYLEAGYVYAPYLPLFATNTVMLDDFVARKGIVSIYGKKALNTRYYSKGKLVV